MHGQHLKKEVIHVTNEKFIVQAIETLCKIEIEKIEGVTVETNNYVDGSSYLSINIDFKKGV